MLVLSRKQGERIVVNAKLPAWLELLKTALENAGLLKDRVFEDMTIEEISQIGFDGMVLSGSVMITDIRPNDKARLGLIFPAPVGLDREEVWERKQGDNPSVATALNIPLGHDEMPSQN